MAGTSSGETLGNTPSNPYTALAKRASHEESVNLDVNDIPMIKHECNIHFQCLAGLDPTPWVVE
eukprot:scaffold3189_cov166-Amphora_coffeaeformis.AAC.8